MHTYMHQGLFHGYKAIVYRTYEMCKPHSTATQREDGILDAMRLRFLRSVAGAVRAGTATRPRRKTEVQGAKITPRANSKQCPVRAWRRPL
jgi:hypothetical protein